MARSFCFALCMLVLLQAYLPSALGSTYPALSSVFSDASTAALSSARNVYSDTITRSSSCSSTSVASYKSNSAAFAFSSNTAKTTAVVGGAVKAAADALADAAVDSNGKCRSSEDTSYVYVVAEACANAMVKGRAESFSVAYASGASSATSQGCAYSSAYAFNLVKGLAGAVSDAVGGAKGKCTAFSSTEGEAYVAAVAKLCISGMAQSWSYAHAEGRRRPGKAVAASQAAYSNDVSVYATAIARLFSYACAKCSTGGNHCTFCNNWMIPAGDWVSTETFGVAAKGRIALAEAISDASSRLCSGTITVDLAVKGCVAAISNVFVQLTASAYGWAKADNKAVACTGAYSSTTGFALGATYAKVVSEAFALAVKKDQCGAVACADIFAEATAVVKFDKFIEAYVSGCASGRSSYPYAEYATACYDHVYDVYAEALSNAFAEITTECKCAGNCWCCNDHPEKRQCSY